MILAKIDTFVKADIGIDYKIYDEKLKVLSLSDVKASQI